MKRSRSPPDGTTSGTQPMPIQLLLHAPGGIVPYLTPTLLNKYFPTPQPHLLLGISVQDTCLAPIFPTPDAIQPRGYEFVSKPPLEYLKSYNSVVVPSFNLLHDASKRGQDSVQATGSGISVWSLQGRQVLSNQAYMGLVLATTTTTTTTGTSTLEKTESSSNRATPTTTTFEQPQFSTIVSLYDQAAVHQSKHRHEQARHRTLKWLQELIHQQQQHTNGSARMTTTTTSSPIWAVVSSSSKNNTNTHNDMEVDDELEQLLDNDMVSGYALVGYSSSDCGGGSSSSTSFIPQLSKTGSSKTVAVLSVTTMQDVLECLEQGVNVIGTDLPTKWSLAHQALVLPLNYSTKKVKENNDTNHGGGESSFLLDLTDKKYAMDSLPLLEGCGCMACGQDFYSRAYIHHLYQAKELLAQILLMGHNLHHMLEFCWVATQAQQEEHKQRHNVENDGQQPPVFDTFLQRCKRECCR